MSNILVPRTMIEVLGQKAAIADVQRAVIEVLGMMEPGDAAVGAFSRDFNADFDIGNENGLRAARAVVEILGKRTDHVQTRRFLVEALGGDNKHFAVGNLIAEVLGQCNSSYLQAGKVSVSGIGRMADLRHPGDVDSLQLWVAADHMNLADGTRTGVWRNQGKGGAAFDFYQNDESRWPIFKTNSFAGLPCIRFNNSSASHSLRSDLNYSSTPCTMFLVARTGYPGAGGLQRRLMSGCNGNWLLGWWSGSQPVAYFEGWVVGGGATNYLQPTLISATVGPDSLKGKLWKNREFIGGSDGIGTYGPNGIDLGGGGQYNESSDCEISEVLVYNRVLSEQEHEAVDNYLYYKYIMRNAAGSRVLWVSADQISASDGDPVSTWLNQESLMMGSYSFSQSNASRRPIYKASSFNGKPCLRFTASSATMLTSDLGFPDNECTIIYAARMGWTGNGSPTAARILSSATGNWLLGWWGNHSKEAFMEGWVANNDAAVDGNIHVYSAVVKYSSPRAKVYADGVDITLSADAGTTLGPSGITLGGWGTGGEYSDCEVAEVMVYNYAMNDVQRSAAEQSLISKYS